MAGEASTMQTDGVFATVRTTDLTNWLAVELQSTRFKDYCPNGLQVSGSTEIRRIVSGVTASEALIHEAIARRANAILVHHGWFWKNEDPRVVGIRRTRLALLLKHDINLIAYHLPLDAHPRLGNNAQLAQVIGLAPAMTADGPVCVGDNDLIWVGSAPGLNTLGQLARRIEERLARTPLVVGNPDQPIGRVAWCTGAAQGMLQQAIDAGADAFITGEVSEPTVHLARESGTGFISAGHHATERYGVQALGDYLARRFALEHLFIDCPNPV